MERRRCSCSTIASLLAVVSPFQLIASLRSSHLRLDLPYPQARVLLKVILPHHPRLEVGREHDALQVTSALRLVRQGAHDGGVGPGCEGDPDLLPVLGHVDPDVTSLFPKVRVQRCIERVAREARNKKGIAGG